MFYLKEAKVSGEKYHCIYSANDFIELKKKADQRFKDLKRRWVIVDDDDKLLSYCDDLDKLLKDCIKMFQKHKRKTNKNIIPFVTEDSYLMRLFDERKIPYMNASEFFTKFAYGNKSS